LEEHQFVCVFFAKVRPYLDCLRLPHSDP
jgi:hypothetical protein